MKIVHISDTHGSHEHKIGVWLEEIAEQEQPSVIVHSGDFMRHAMNYQDLTDFLEWFMKLPFQHKILVPGNHDIWTEQLENNNELRQAVLPYGLHFLIDEEVVIDGVKFYGSPYTPWFCDWGFQLYQHEQEVHWKQIPDDTDVLITHGPAKNVLDYISLQDGVPKEALGCAYLGERIAEIDIKAHLFGHIHGAYGKSEQSGYTALNSAVMSENYTVINKPQVVEI
jgi:3',5'-cyclic AMP phosphodiesterase CpdA